jgi:hypothetical protein
LPAHRDKRPSLKRRRIGKLNDTTPWRTKLPSSEAPNFHPLQIFRPGRICKLLDIDKSTLWRWRKQGILPPFVTVGGIEGLTGEQLQTLLAQRREEAP